MPPAWLQTSGGRLHLLMVVVESEKGHGAADGA
jgi:hypothetical protein